MTNGQVTPRFDISVAEALDAACMRILDAASWHVPVKALRINTKVYELVAHAKARELARGEPLLLLGLPVVADDAVEVGRPELA